MEEVHMSYRNDHDAALNRVAALESELARLRGERSEVKETKRIEPEERGDEQKLMGVLVAGAAAILGAVGLVWRVTSAESTAAADDEDMSADNTALTAPVVRMEPVRPMVDDETCANEIEARAVSDARAADPRGASPIKAVELMRAPIVCGGTAGVLSVEEANVSSLITVYYENDPVTADRYESAEQLWREYHRARAHARR